METYFFFKRPSSSVFVKCVSYLDLSLRVETPGVNFTNILQEVITHADPKSAKNSIKQTAFFVLLGSARLKAAR